ncbi:hypothetical protein LMG33818_000672 [Halomonadaceae bacterium LMG 33818]|uniref:hypothetical protein n=1 Tax=Cernens ardua TaxID=3402176 RepID=UPI003EDC1793
MEIINQLIETHDTDTTGTATLLKELDPASIDPHHLSSYSWLLNHVLGELMGDWQAAFERHRKIVFGNDIPKGIYLNHAISALYSGHPLQAMESQSRYREITQSTVEDVALLVELMTLQYSSTKESKSDSFLAVFKDVLEKTRDWNGPPQMATTMASAFNNIVSHWVEQPIQPSSPIDNVMEAAAAQAQSLWVVGGGNWMNAERAYYLRALVANHLFRWEMAKDMAQKGIEIIDKNGDEVVDRACLLLELSRAYGGLSQHKRQQETWDEALNLSQTFAQKFPDEPGLKAWFEGLMNR